MSESDLNNVIDKHVNDNIIKPATRECNYFMKHGKFKNFDKLYNKRARNFTLTLIKKKCKELNITEYDEIIQGKETK